MSPASGLRHAVLEASLSHPAQAGAHDPTLLPDLLASVTTFGGDVIVSSAERLVVLTLDPRAALSLARTLVARVQHSRPRPGYRIVLGYGHVSVDDEGVVGDWVHSLRRAAELLPEDSIGVQPLFGDQLTPADREQLIPVERSRGALLVFTEVGELQLTRAARVEGASADAVFSQLSLIVGGVERLLSAGDRPLTIGRDRSCDLIVSGEAVSRVHGRVEFQRDKFYYVDESRNGSWVLTPAGEELRVHEEPIALIGEGAISPGLPLGQQTAVVVRYRCHSSRSGLDRLGSERGEITQPLHPGAAS